MREKMVDLQVPGIRNNNLGDNLDVIENEARVVDGTITPVSLSPGDINSINDNYLLGPTLANKLVQKLPKRVVQRPFQTVKLKVVDSSKQTLNKIQSSTSLNVQNVSCLAVNPVHSVCSPGLPQKKCISPFVKMTEIKDVKSAFCVNQCVSVPHALNAPSVVLDLAVGARLQRFWQTWLQLGANPRVVSILKEGYTLPYKIRPPLTRFPIIKSGYAHPLKSKALKNAF